MKVKEKIYKYLGRNGILITKILIEDIKPIPMVNLSADEGKILTNGEKFVYSVTIEKDEINEWQEVDDIYEHEEEEEIF